jgi:hypothetical protein
MLFGCNSVYSFYYVNQKWIRTGAKAIIVIWAIKPNKRKLRLNRCNSINRANVAPIKLN